MIWWLFSSVCKLCGNCRTRFAFQQWNRFSFSHKRSIKGNDSSSSVSESQYWWYLLCEDLMLYSLVYKMTRSYPDLRVVFFNAIPGWTVFFLWSGFLQEWRVKAYLMAPHRILPRQHFFMPSHLRLGFWGEVEAWGLRVEELEVGAFGHFEAEVWGTSASKSPKASSSALEPSGLNLTSGTQTYSVRRQALCHQVQCLNSWSTHSIRVWWACCP
jgi:hypothetical protein